MIKTALVSGMEKCFPDQQIEDFAPLTALSVLKNERFSVQLLHKSEPDHAGRAIVRIDGELAKYATVRNVKCIPVYIAISPALIQATICAQSPVFTPICCSPCITAARSPL